MQGRHNSPLRIGLEPINELFPARRLVIARLTNGYIKSSIRIHQPPGMSVAVETPSTHFSVERKLNRIHDPSRCPNFAR